MKTIVRITVTLPDNTATIQRLYDLGISFRLEREYLSGAAKIADFITALKAKGGYEINRADYISDDDFLPHFSVTYEYISNS